MWLLKSVERMLMNGYDKLMIERGDERDDPIQALREYKGLLLDTYICIHILFYITLQCKSGRPHAAQVTCSLNRL